jgi:hypothetical protein
MVKVKRDFWLLWHCSLRLRLRLEERDELHTFFPRQSLFVSRMG